ncbi:MAG: tRNA (adenosine(37)-N6)-threonylcarbamoyltransferase complex dimerization subunit type 1 TsaB [Gammaproteobacteria bacterium]|nr:tRNA (adenosine(37)-N6)-threonylcarbamoyltransferase complex dimerization subunit type 1 TsaB [Gammaproteobacteria bacterium]
MKILALESSTEACSVALMDDDAIISRHEVAPRRHAELILPFMDELLAEAELSLSQIDALAFGRGPGAFTGIRIATGVIQGIAFAVDLPVVAVSTLAAVAQGSAREQGITKAIVANDARMDEVYWGAYTLDPAGRMQALAEECVVRPEEVPTLEGEGWYGTGSGWSIYGNVLTERYGQQLNATESERLPHAQDVAWLARGLAEQGQAVTAEQALPVYLRDKVAEKKKNQA